MILAFCLGSNSKYTIITPQKKKHFLALLQNKFKDEPVILITAEHLRTGKEYDAALIWTEDVTKNAFKVCLRELQNFDGRHEDISVVCTLQQNNKTNVSVK